MLSGFPSCVVPVLISEEEHVRLGSSLAVLCPAPPPPAQGCPEPVPLIARPNCFGVPPSPDRPRKTHP